MIKLDTRLAAGATAALMWSVAACGGVQSLDSVFTPNAPVCVKFDAKGRVKEVAVEGRSDRWRLNSEMLRLLNHRKWDPPAKALVGKWIALSVAPDGSPVTELLPDCTHLGG